MRSDDYERCINRAMTTTRDVSTGQWRLREMYQQGNDTLLGLGQCKRDSCPNAQNIVLWGNWFGDNVCGVQMFLNVYNISKRSRMTQMDVNGQKHILMWTPHCKRETGMGISMMRYSDNHFPGTSINLHPVLDTIWWLTGGRVKVAEDREREMRIRVEMPEWKNWSGGPMRRDQSSRVPGGPWDHEALSYGY